MPDFPGRHYETGTIVNALHAMGVSLPESMALGASGGIAFGYFVFEYKGLLPHVALLARNTFSPFERALDNLGIRRETRETTNAEKAEESLRKELDFGQPVIVWADMYTLPYRGLNQADCWAMIPMLVTAAKDGGFLVVDGTRAPFIVEADVLTAARGRVKKDRYRQMTLQAPDESILRQQIGSAIGTACALMLDKPPAGSANNFGVSAMHHMAECLLAKKGPKSWAKQFAAGPNLVQALAGKVGQPGVWDWIETWGTAGSADRLTYVDYLRSLTQITGNPGFEGAVPCLVESAAAWSRLADACLPDSVPAFARLHDLKSTYRALWYDNGPASAEARAEVRKEMQEITAEIGGNPALVSIAPEIQSAMATNLLEIAHLELDAFERLRQVTL